MHSITKEHPYSLPSSGTRHRDSLETLDEENGPGDAIACAENVSNHGNQLERTGRVTHGGGIECHRFVRHVQ